MVKCTVFSTDFRHLHQAELVKCWQACRTYVVIVEGYHRWPAGRPVKGPLTLKFDTLTWPFLKIHMRHEAYQHGKNIITWAVPKLVIRLSLNRHGYCKNRDRGHCHFLNSTCDIGDPPSRAPVKAVRAMFPGE